MNPERPTTGCCSRATLNGIGIAGVFLAMVALVAALKHYTSVVPVDQVRAAERHKILAEARQKARTELDTADWADAEKKAVRLPNALAMSLAVEKWKDPKAARADLLERADKVFFVPPPPPPPPEAPSEFE